MNKIIQTETPSELITRIKNKPPSDYSMAELAEFIDQIAEKYDSLRGKKYRERAEIQEFYSKLATVYNKRSGKLIFKKRLID